MTVMDAPDELEVKDFYFKQVIRFRVHSNAGGPANQRFSVLAVSNKYGLTFVGVPAGFHVYKTSDITKRASEIEKAASTIIDDLGKWAAVNCNATPCLISLSADDLTLSVCVKEGSSVFAHMYDVRAFAVKDAHPSPFLSVRLSSKDGDLQDLAWNPSADYSSMFVSCMSDGDLALWEVKDTSLHVVASVADAGATCVCWSPKGKQVAVGRKDGSVVQFDHQLKVKKEIPGPTGLAGDPAKVLDLLWQSTHVFMAAYVPQDEANTEPPSLVMISVPKGEAPRYINYEDVCYGGGENRKHRYYFISLVDWDLVIASSAAAAESAVLGRNAQSSLWERWSLDDSGRAEMPLTDDHFETYPLGIAVDFTQQEEILISDTLKHSPSPLFMALSTDGFLMVYYMINKQPNARQLNTPAQPLSNQGERKSMGAPQPSAVSQAPKMTPAAEPSKFTTIFGGSANTATAKPLGGATVASVAPSSGFSFGGQPTISFAKPAAQISAANAQKPAFSFNSTETTPSFGGAFGVNKSIEGGTAFKPPAPVAQQPATSGFAFQKPAPAPDASKMAQTAAAPKPAMENMTAPQLPTSGFSLNQQPTQPAAPAFPAQSPAKIISNLPPAAAVTSRGIAGSQTPARPVETPAGFQGSKVPGTVQTSSGMQNKPQASVAPVRSPSKRSVDGAVENPFLKSIMDEVKDFNHELLEMKRKALSLRVDIGSRDEMIKLREQTHNVSEFCGDIKLTMKSLNEDIHSSKANCLEGFALIEECTARQQRSSDPRYQQLLASRALDPMSAKRMKEIRTQLQYVDSSIRDVDGRMDEQWERYMNRQNQSRKMYVPLSDTIYQTIKNNHSIYSNQCKLLEQVTSQLQELKVSNKSSWQPTSTGTPSGGRLGSLSNSPMFSPATKTSSPRNSNQSPRASPLSPEKSARLREFLGKRRVTPIKATAPANLSMSKIAAAESLRHSLLEDSTTPPFSPEVAIRERIISNDFRADLASSTPLRPITTGARQSGTEPQAIPVLNPVIPVRAPAQRLTEGFQRIPEGSSSSIQGAPLLGGIKTGMPSQMVKDAPNGAAAKPSLPTFGATANLPKPVFSFGTSGKSVTTIQGGALSGLQKPPAEGSATGKPQPSSTALTMTLGPGGAPTVATIATTGATRTTTVQPGFSFGITTGIAKPAAMGFTFGAPGSPASKPPDKPVAPSGSYKPTVEDITPPGTPPVEREDPEGFQQDDEHKPTIIPKLAKPDSSNNMLKNLLVGSSTAVTKTTAVTTTTASITSHPSRSLFTVGAESSGSGADFGKSPVSTQPISLKLGQGSPGGVNRVTKNLFGTVSGQSAGGAAASGTDSGPVSFSVAGKEDGGSESESTSPSPQQLDDDDAAEGQDAAGGTDATVKPSSETVATTTAAPSSGFSFSLGAPPATATTVSGFSFTPPGGQSTASSMFGTSSKTSVFGGTGSSSQTSFGSSGIFGKFGGSAIASTLPSTGSASSGVASSPASVSSSTKAVMTMSPASSATEVAPTTSASDATSSSGNMTSAVTVSSSSSTSGFVFSTTANTASANTTGGASTAASPAPVGFSFTTPSSSLFGKPAASVASGTSTAAVTSTAAATTTATATTTPPTVAASSENTSATTTSMFGAPSSTSATTGAPSTANTSTTGSSFGPSASKSLFGGQTSGSSSVFGSTTSTTSVFGGATSSTTPASSTTTPAFGAATTAATSGTTSIFGGATTTSANTSVFGGSSATSGATTSVFGGGSSTPASTSATASIFGGGESTPASTSATTSMFGGAGTTGATSTSGATTSVFGGTAPASSAPSIFGASTPVTSTTSVFGTTPASSGPTTSIFGGGAPVAATTAAAPATSSSGSIFGGGSVFGGTSNASSSPFGSTTTAAFGNSAFGTTSAFSQPSSGAGGFGTSSTFGQSTSVFGGQPSGTGGSIFGGTSAAAPPSSGGLFGQTTSANTASATGVFGGTAGGGGGGGGGGGLFSGLGGKPSAENANKNVFGGNVSFGNAGSSGNALFGQQQGNQMFGQGSGPSFGNSGTFGNQGSQGSGSFSSGNQGSIAAAGFGGFQTPPKQTGTFGGTPAFGGTATFGSTSPTFGGGAVFGSPPTYGGVPQPSAGGLFGGGASSNSSAGFAGFASAQAPSFGALAGTGQPAFGGGGAAQGFDMAQQSGSVFGGGGNNQNQGPNNGFGSPAPTFGGGGGGSPAFSAYRG